MHKVEVTELVLPRLLSCFYTWSVIRYKYKSPSSGLFHRRTKVGVQNTPPFLLLTMCKFSRENELLKCEFPDKKLFLPSASDVNGTYLSPSCHHSSNITLQDKFLSILFNTRQATNKLALFRRDVSYMGSIYTYDTVQDGQWFSVG